MITLVRRPLPARLDDERDRGTALITVVLFIAVVAALAGAVGLVSVNNEQNAGRDRQAGGALATSEAGVAQAIEYIRNTTVGLLNCTESPPSAACALTSADAGYNPWTSSAAPQTVRQDGTVGACAGSQSCYQVWIGTLCTYVPVNPAAGCTAGVGTYRIHSTGYFGNGPGARSVEVDVKVRPAKLPIGVYANSISTGGTTGVHHESIFSLGCVYSRIPDGSGGASGVSFEGVDPQYDMPAAAHSVQYVTQSNNKCSPATPGSSNQANVHDPSFFGVCHSPGMVYDQDAQGGDLTSTPCYNAWTDATTGKQYPTTSKFTMQDLQSYGYRPGGLSPSEYAALKAMAQAQGTYFTSASASPYTSLNTNLPMSAVVYFDLSGGQTVTLKPGDFPTQYFRQPTDSGACSVYSVIVIVRNGNLTFNAAGYPANGPSLVAMLLVPEGTYSGQGNANVIGTVFANNITLSGTQDLHLDQCFVDNPPGPILNVTVTNYREVDTQNVQ